MNQYESDQNRAAQEQTPQAEQAPVNDSVVVNPETFLTVQMAQFDDQVANENLKIAEAELEVAKAEVELAKIRKQRTLAVLDYNIQQIKKSATRQSTQATASAAPVTPDAAAPETASRAERRRRRHKG